MSLNLTEPTLTELNKYSSIVEVFQDVEADPSIKTLLHSIEVGKKINATGVIGFGGGSSMDVAKLTSLILGSNENIEDAWGVSNAKGPRLPLILIPTTAGTGSEVTPISIITVGEEEKKGVSSPIILPDIAILDPDLTIGLPAHTTAATGIDAMVHAIEGYTSSNKNNNPISKMLAIEALKLLSGSIEKAVFDGSNIEARGNMLIGAMLAGKAFANSPVAAVHALAYPIGGTFHVSHGLSNSLVLPYVLRFNSVDSKTTKNYAELAPFVFQDINTEKGSQAVCKEFIDRLENLSQKIGLPQRLREVNIPKEACKKMASDAMKQTRLLVNNPRELTENDALNIYEAAW
jgi:alcohol dehydrogenase class IV